MNKHWHYLEREMARRIEIYNRELAESRREQQLIQRHVKAVIKAVRHFTLRGVETVTSLIHKGLSTFKRSKDTKETL